MNRRSIVSAAGLLALAAVAAPAQGAGIDTFFQITTPIPSMEGQGDVANIVITFDVAAAAGLPSGTAVEVNGLDWDVTLFADPAVGPFGGSWLSELTWGVSADGDLSPDVTVRPGVGDDIPGTATYTSGGVLKFDQFGIPNIILPNGLLRMEFFEGFNDAAGPDGAWLGGVLSVQIVPTPGAAALLGLGGILTARRRR